MSISVYGAIHWLQVIGDPFAQLAGIGNRQLRVADGVTRAELQRQ